MSDRRVLKLVRQWLRAGVMEDGRETSNIYLSFLDNVWHKHPEKTRRVDLSRGRQGFDVLGCHLRKRMSGPIWMKERREVYLLQRWPSTKSTKRVRQRVKELTPKSRRHDDPRTVIAALNPVLRGRGQYFAPETLR